jgi:hypothetical protein
VPLGPTAEPGEIANVVAFLACDQASYVNGADFHIDAGCPRYPSLRRGYGKRIGVPVHFQRDPCIGARIKPLSGVGQSNAAT